MLSIRQSSTGLTEKAYKHYSEKEGSNSSPATQGRELQPSQRLFQFAQARVEQRKQLVQFRLFDREGRADEEVVAVHAVGRAAARIDHQPAFQADSRQLRVHAPRGWERLFARLVLH